MKKSVLITLVAALVISAAGYAQSTDKWVSSKSHIKFFSSTPFREYDPIFKKAGI